MNKPVVLLAYAGYGNQSDLKLEMLDEELKGIERHLERAKARGWCEFYSIPNATASDIVEKVAQYADDLVIFHFAGHTNSYQLLLRDFSDGRQQSASPAALAEFLAKKAPNLQLLFLNGCETQGQVSIYQEYGIPLVLATYSRIGDAAARDFALYFYEQLSAGRSIEEAYESHEYKHRIGETKHRGEGFLIDSPKDQFPWDLFPKKGAELYKAWSFPKMKGDCLFFLPPLPNDIVYPPQPFKNLRRYEREDALIFFGRSCLIKDLYEEITSPYRNKTPIILLYGQSGVGKSSVLQAGLLPRLEREQEVYLYARPVTGGLARPLYQYFGSNDPTVIKQKWLDKERAAKKPFTLIVDQVEEVYTIPDPDVENELLNFGRLLKTLFTGGESVEGKVILSFREEYLGRVKQELGTVLPIFLPEIRVDRLREKAIFEVVEGLSKDKNPEAPYGLKVTSELAPAIARDLSRDAESPVATVLQVLLTKMWEQTESSRQGSGEKVFDLELYRQIEEEGNWIQRLFEEQLGKLAAWDDIPIATGLVYDLLYFLTTKRATAGLEKKETLLERYNQHPPEHIEQLITRLKQYYLLSEATIGDAEAVRLTHDVLAPVVIEKYRTSDTPGQVAARLWDSKSGTNEDQMLPLNEAELSILDHGSAGMRALSLKEKDFVEKCRNGILAEQRKKRRSYILQGMLAVATLVLIVSTVLFFWQRNKSLEINRVLTQSRQIADDNPTQAFQLLRSVWEENKAEINLLTELKKLYGEHILYDSILLNNGLEAAPAKIAASSTEKLLALSYANAGTFSVFLFAEDEAGDLVKEQELSGPESTVQAIRFSKNDQYVIAGGADHVIHLWEVGRSAVSQKYGFEGEGKPGIECIDMATDNRILVAGDNTGNITVWQFNQTTPRLILDLPEVSIIHAIALHPDNQWLLAGTDKGLFLCDLANASAEVLANTTGIPINSVAFSEEGQQALYTIRDEVVYLNFSEDALSEVDRLQRDNVNFDQAYFAANGRMIVTIASEIAYVWAPAYEADPIFELKGHSEKISSASLSKSPNILLFTNDVTGGLLRWQIPVTVPIQRLATPTNADIERLQYIREGNYLLTASRNGNITGWQMGTAGALTPDWTYTGHGSQRIVALDAAKATATIASADNGGQIRIWRLEDQQTVDSLTVAGGITDLVITSDGTLVLIGLENNNAILWNLKTNQQQTLTGHAAGVSSVLFLPPENIPVTGGLDGKVILWDQTRFEPIRNFSYPDQLVLDLDHQPNSSNFTVVTDGNVLHFVTLTGKSSSVDIPNGASLLEWSNAGDLLALEAANGLLEIRDQSGFLIHTLNGPGNLKDLSISTDGQFLVGAYQNNIVVWRNDKEPLAAFLGEE